MTTRASKTTIKVDPETIEMFRRRRRGILTKEAASAAMAEVASRAAAELGERKVEVPTAGVRLTVAPSSTPRRITRYRSQKHAAEFKRRHRDLYLSPRYGHRDPGHTLSNYYPGEGWGRLTAAPLPAFDGSPRSAAALAAWTQRLAAVRSEATAAVNAADAEIDAALGEWPWTTASVYFHAGDLDYLVRVQRTLKRWEFDPDKLAADRPDLFDAYWEVAETEVHGHTLILSTIRE